MAESKCGGACGCSCKTKIAELQGVIDVFTEMLLEADAVLETCENDLADDGDDAERLELLRNRIENAIGERAIVKRAADLLGMRR